MEYDPHLPLCHFCVSLYRLLNLRNNDISMSEILGESIYARVKSPGDQKKTFMAYPVKKTSSITVHFTLNDACF